MKRQGLLSLTGIMLLTLIVLMTLHEWEDVVVTTPPEAAQTLPTLKLKGVTGQSYDADGQADVLLNARSVSWQESGDQARIEEPQLTVSLDSGLWLISAAQGTMHEPDGVVTLTGNVRARLDGPGATALQSDLLTFTNSSQAVVSPGPVTLTNAQTVTRAGALQADMKRNVLTFTGGVETRYVQP